VRAGRRKQNRGNRTTGRTITVVVGDEAGDLCLAWDLWTGREVGTVLVHLGLR